MVTSKSYSFYSQVKNALSFLKKKTQNLPMIFLSEMVSNEKSSFQYLMYLFIQKSSPVESHHTHHYHLSIFALFIYQRIAGYQNMWVLSGPKYIKSFIFSGVLSETEKLQFRNIILWGKNRKNNNITSNIFQSFIYNWCLQFWTLSFYM